MTSCPRPAVTSSLCTCLKQRYLKESSIVLIFIFRPPNVFVLSQPLCQNSSFQGFPSYHVQWSILRSHGTRPLSSVGMEDHFFLLETISSLNTWDTTLWLSLTNISFSFMGCCSSIQLLVFWMNEKQSWTTFSFLSVFSSLVISFNFMISNTFKFLSKHKLALWVPDLVSSCLYIFLLRCKIDFPNEYNWNKTFKPLLHHL